MNPGKATQQFSRRSKVVDGYEGTPVPGIPLERALQDCWAILYFNRCAGEMRRLCPFVWIVSGNPPPGPKGWELRPQTRPRAMAPSTGTKRPE